MRWVCGDQHGCIFTLEHLLAKIREQDPEPSLYFIGDYADRGMHSKEMLECLVGLQENGAVFIRGNHDDVVDYLVNDHSESYPSEWVSMPPTIEKVVSWWMRNGFDTTCTSYGIKLPPIVFGPYGARVSEPDAEVVVQELRSAMPYAHKQFLRDLKLWHEETDFFLFHGYHRPFDELPRDFKFLRGNPHEWLWSRFNEHLILDPDFSPAWDKKGIFGHTPVSCYGETRPISLRKLVLIDTGAFMKQGMAAYCVDTDASVYVESDARDLHPKW